MKALSVTLAKMTAANNTVTEIVGTATNILNEYNSIKSA